MSERPKPIIAVTNQKGGVGKTTLSINLASALVERGAKVLLVDIDPQANSTSGLGVDPADGPTVYNLLLNARSDPASAIRATSLENLHLLPSSPALRGADIALAQQIGAEHILRETLAGLTEYDYIFIDCPPALNRLTLNALAAASHVLVPVQLSGKWPLEGTGQLLETIDLVRERLNPSLAILGVVPTFYESGTELGEVILENLSAHFGDLVFATRVHHAPTIGEASIADQPVVLYATESAAAENFRALAAELEARVSGVRTPPTEPEAPAPPAQPSHPSEPTL
jgi:chromosome partitioning protein